MLSYSSLVQILAREIKQAEQTHQTDEEGLASREKQVGNSHPTYTSGVQTLSQERQDNSP